MSHWFHRNPIKATIPIDFDKRSYPSSSDAQTICSLLKQSRARLLQAYCEPANSYEAVQAEFATYVSLLVGFCNDVATGRSSGGDSKLRYSIRSKWTQSLGASFIYEEQDAMYEMSSIVTTNALWLTKHAAYIAATVIEPAEKEAKEVHKSLKVAGGQFKFVQEVLNSKLIKSSQVQPFFDITDNIMTAYVNQCKAEAQEITIARAIELKHSPGLISSIAQSTSALFLSAAESIMNLDKAVCQKWTRYLALKSKFYKAQAYCYFGQDLLDHDKCGEAIKCLQESATLYRETEQLCKIYAETKGPGTQAVPERHQFFKNLGKIIARISEKCNRENGMIYHQKVPLELPVLESKSMHGLAEPEPYEFPPAHSLWTPAIYDSFNLAKGLNEKDKSASKKTPNPVPDEAAIPQGSADPKTESGCSIS